MQTIRLATHEDGPAIAALMALSIERLQRGVLVGCGGWGRRATLFGGNHAAVRDQRLLDPATEPARVRAMYTHPDFARQGIGRRVLAASEQAAATAGFLRAELAATLAGVPLYLACGWTALERIASAPIDGIEVPLLRMGKTLG